MHVTFRVPTSQKPKPSAGALRRVGRLAGLSPRATVLALRGLSFVAREGESVGIVGQNGSGKSTLLRTMAGLQRPSRGEVHASSEPVLLGVNAALQQELSGVANVRLGLLAMGMTPERADATIGEVIDLAGIGDSIHLPMRTYSSGMAARLRFAIACASKPHILLIDEALNTGDAAFKERSKQSMDELRRQAGTVFIVSHAAETIQEMCTRAIWLDKGDFVMDGHAEEVALKYRWWAWNIAKGKPKKANRLLNKAKAEGKMTAVYLNREIVEDDDLAPRHALRARK
nr:ABC transporter ATP-binding protein [Spelaeicoccus albus]